MDRPGAASIPRDASITDEHILPDALSPRNYDSHHGRPRSYWTERNALVDAVHAIDNRAPSCVDDLPAFRAWLHGPDGEAYRAALAALREFDDSHGGSPIL